MKFPKVILPFLAVVLPTVHFANDNLQKSQTNINNPDSHDEEVTAAESDTQNIILRRFDDSERFLRFSSHSSHRSHTSHSSHKSHQSGNHNSHSSHTSGSDCNGCWFNVEDENIPETTNNETLVALK